MLFNSIAFLLFFPAVCLVYYLLPPRARNPVLLLASCIFYMAFEPRYILLCVFIIALDYGSGLLLARLRGGWQKFVLICSLLLSFAPLFIYKYFDFLADLVSRVGAFCGLSLSVGRLSLLLPVGISFLTFQSFGYCIEVYRCRAPERRPLTFALFVMFFPQLVAGPIERIDHLLPQFDEVHSLTRENLHLGLRRMLWGFFKKMVVADQLALVVDRVYSAPGEFGSGWLWVATLLFAVQIYCDFSGYSDIAVGTARVLGFRLMENFRRPYAASSVPEFWRRWHISLSTWFRDYLYIPMGGSRCSSLRRDLNLLVTFTVSGLWHGAGLTYALWGLLNGLWQVISLHTRSLRDRLARIFGTARHPRLRRGIAVVLTFLLIDITWVFFRADTVGDALTVLRGMVPGSLPLSAGVSGELLRDLLFGLLAVGILLITEVSASTGRGPARWFGRSRALRTVLYLLLCIIIMGLGVRADAAQFIYFQF